MIQAEESPIKHTTGAEIPGTSVGSKFERRIEADLPLLSDPVVIRNISMFFGSLVVGLGMIVYLYRRRR